MRDVNRLHMDNFPDWRFGQLVNNLERWLQVNKKINDIFYIEEDTMLRYINEFVDDIKG